MNLCLDERQCFHDDPYFRQSLRQSQEKLDVFNDLLFSLILKVKAYGQLNEGPILVLICIFSILCRFKWNQFGSCESIIQYQSIVRTRTRHFINGRKVHLSMQWSATWYYQCIQCVPLNTYLSIITILVTSLTTLTQHMAELNSERQKTLSNVYNQILNPLVEFHQHLETLSKVD